MRKPGTITQRNKPRLAILSYEDFETLRKGQDERKAYKLEDMPDDSFALLKAGFEACKKEGDEA